MASALAFSERKIGVGTVSLLASFWIDIVSQLVQLRPEVVGETGSL